VKIGSAIQVSGVTPNNFTSPVTYTVTAADGSIQNYTVTVRAGALPAQWARTVTSGSDYSAFNSLSVASDGSVYAAGTIYGTGTYNFDNYIYSSGTYTELNIVLVKYTSSGVAQWAQTVTAGSNNSSFDSVSVASDGSVYAAGYINGTGTYNFGYGKTAAGTSSTSNIVLVKYSSAGTAQWARSVTAGSDASNFISVSVAPDGSIYAGGQIYGTGTYNFGNNVTAAGTSSGTNLILVKYSSSGVAQWARTATAGSDASYILSVSVASDGSVYVGGFIDGTGTHNFGNSITAAGTSSTSNIVLVKYNSSGTAQWARTMTAGSSMSYFYGVSVASDGSVYAAGYIAGSSIYNFGNTVSATGTSSNDNIMLVKYNSSGTAQWAQTVTAGVGSSDLFSVFVASDGSVYAAGLIHGAGTYNFGNNVTATGTNANANIVLVRYTSSGVAQWAQTMTAGSDQSSFGSVSVAFDGSVYAAGYMTGTGTYNFGNSVTVAGPTIYRNLVLVKYY
jgi:hypothetical protein